MSSPNLLQDCVEKLPPSPTPEWVERICAEFGTSESGKPTYRVIWAPDRIDYCYDRPMKPYGHIGNRWIIEVLVPWEKFGPWNEQAFGPKPLDGEYCHSQTIQQTWEGDVSTFDMRPGIPHRYMSLDDFGGDALRLTLACIDRGKAIQWWQMKNHREMMIEKEDKGFHEQFENVYDDNAGAVADIRKLSKQAKLATSLDELPQPIKEKVRRRGPKQIRN